MRGRTPLCPQRRPPRLRQPFFGVFRRGGLRCGRHTPAARRRTDGTGHHTHATGRRVGGIAALETHGRARPTLRAPPNGGNCTIRGATRRRHADRMLLMVQNPHHYPWRHAPARVERPRSGGIFPMGRILSEERRCEQASLTTPPSTTPGTEPRPTRYAHNRRPVCARSGLLPPRRPGEGAPASLRGVSRRTATRGGRPGLVEGASERGQRPGGAPASNVLEEGVAVRAVPDGDGLGDRPQRVGDHRLEGAVGHELFDL